MAIRFYAASMAELRRCANTASGIQWLYRWGMTHPHGGHTAVTDVAERGVTQRQINIWWGDVGWLTKHWHGEELIEIVRTSLPQAEWCWWIEDY